MQNHFASRILTGLLLSLLLAALPLQGLAQEQEPKKPYCFLDMPRELAKKSDYVWTTNHMHVGVRWQPYPGRPGTNACDAARPAITKVSSYAQFWVSWTAIEPTEAHKDYTNKPSGSLKTIEKAVEVCRANGIKVEFVFFHCPKWANKYGKAGGFMPTPGFFEGFVKRIATHFKGRVHAYQLSHEANLQGLMHGADINFMINDILLKGAQTIREVYEAEPAVPVIVSTTGMSPCETCGARKGLDGIGARAVSHFYDLMIANRQLMNTVDALNLNVSDHFDGYGCMDGSIIPSVWGQYDLVRGKLDAAKLRSKSVLASESWITWDDAGGNTYDVNGDGAKNEKDAYHKAVTIIGQCMQRGLNTINFLLSDNSSGWAMGLTKRLDYNGRIKTLKPETVIAANDGGPDIVTRKVTLRGRDDNFTIKNGAGYIFTVEDYINPPDPNHLHYYIWKWYAQAAGGSDEVIRHAMAGEVGNDIVAMGPGFTGNERYRISSWNRTRKRFTVLLHASGANGKSWAKLSIPSKIKSGRYYNNGLMRGDFRGEGFANGDTYYARVISKDISIENGSDVNPFYFEAGDAKVENETLRVTIPRMNRFTAIEFIRRPQKPKAPLPPKPAPPSKQPQPKKTPSNSSARPNVIFFLVDDLGWRDLGCTGSRFYETPNVDRLAAEGVLFTDAYAASPVCSPTRASIQSGKYPSRIGMSYLAGVRGAYGPRHRLIPPNVVGNIPHEDTTLAEALKESSYTTAHIGKWHLQGHGEKGNANFPDKHGFNINIAGHKAGQPGSYFYPYNNERHAWSNVPDMDKGKKGDYLTDALTDRAINFIEKHHNKPFYLNMCYYTVHTPIEPRKDKLEKYRKKAKAMDLEKTSREVVPDHQSFTHAHQDFPPYAAMVESMDENIGRILGALKRLKLDKNTIVVFFSDNGGLSTGSRPMAPTSNLPLRAGKAWLYEGGIRVPLIIKVPAATQNAGRKIDEPVVSTDIYPTLLELAGLPLRPKQHVDGISLKPLLSGQKKSLDREAIYFHLPHYHHINTMGPSGAVRMGDHKLIEVFETGKVELYNLRNDIGEQNNLAESEPELSAKLKTMLDKWRKASGSLMATTNPDYKKENDWRIPEKRSR